MIQITVDDGKTPSGSMRHVVDDLYEIDPLSSVTANWIHDHVSSRYVAIWPCCQV